jgi:hypothetical protein
MLRRLSAPQSSSKHECFADYRLHNRHRSMNASPTIGSTIVIEA